jgi:hypothetical protein
VIEYAKWLEPTLDIDARRDQAQRLLARIRAQRQ